MPGTHQSRKYAPPNKKQLDGWCSVLKTIAFDILDNLEDQDCGLAPPPFPMKHCKTDDVGLTCCMIDMPNGGRLSCYYGNPKKASKTFIRA